MINKEIDKKLKNLLSVLSKLSLKEKKVGLTGEVELILRDSNGNEKQRRTVKNLIVNTGLYHIIDRLEVTPSEAGMNWVAIGDNNTAPTADDVALANELGRVVITSKIQQATTNANKIIFSATVPAGTGTGTITEAGIFNAALNGIMLCRSIFTGIPKPAGDGLDMTWTIQANAG